MEFVTKVKALLTMLSESAKAQTAIASVLGVLAIGGVGIGGFSMYEHFYGPEAMVSAEVNTENTQTQTEELVASATEDTEEIIETETETETEQGPVLVKLVGSSIEKDLKVKIQTEEKKNIKGEEFYITVTPDKRNATGSTYSDHDNDGIIYITDIDGGDYLVALEEIEGYYTEEESIKVTVKEEIEYVKVEIEDEIKSEDEVAPEEDAEIKDNVEVEAEIKDTVTWLDSTVTATEVAASTLDKTPYLSGIASVGENCTPVTIPKAESLTAVSFSFKNLFLMRMGTEEGLLPITEGEAELIDNSENPQTEGAESSSETTTETETESQTPDNSENAGNTEDTENSGDSEVPDDSENPDNSETPDNSENEGNTEVPDNTENEGNTETPDNSENSGTTSGATATVAMPKTAKVFMSTRSAANLIEFAVTIDDKNTTKIVDEAGIIWSVKDDKTGDGTSGSGLIVSGKGKTVKVSATKAKKAGTATVVATIPYTVSGTTKTVALECVVTVMEDSYDPTIVLEDSTGTILYSDKSCTKVATVADLVEKNLTTFYKNPKYQGWQTLDGKLYYYGADNKPVTGEQTISGIKYKFGPDGALSQGLSVTGIDVSKYQPNIDWKTVKASGIEFAIIRVGFRGSSSGALVEDPYFKQHIKGATDAGLKVGVYFFTQAITKAEAVEEASMALALTKGYNLEYPIFIDTERASGNARANNLSKANRTEIVEAFCKTVQNAGRKAGVYASKSWYNDQLNVSKLDKYCIWVAQYNTSCTYNGRYSIWQYTETGKVPGISGYVDLNISYMN